MTLADSTPASRASENLSARLERLEAENSRLRSSLEREGAVPPRTHRAGVWRGIVSAVCIVLAAILVPVSVVAGWARAQLVDETRFVSTFAPLVHEPAVQAMIVDETATAINSSVDFAGITNDLFDGIQSLGLPPRASAAVDLLRGPAVQGLKTLVTTAVTRVVASDAFSSVWQRALTASHRALVAAATGGNSGGALSISDSGQIGIQLSPIIDAVTQRLVDQGVGVASSIPTIDKTIVVARSDTLATVRVVYNAAVTVGIWLPFLALGLLLAGILAARRSSTAVLGSGVGLALGGASLASGIVLGGTVLALSAPQLGISSAALDAIYVQLVDAMQRTAIVVAVIGVVLAVLAWTAGRWRGARTTRRAVGAVNASIRTALAVRGVDTGRFGAWMCAQRVLVRTVLAVLVVGWLLLLRPLSVSDVTVVLLVGLLAWWLAELVQKRPGTVMMGVGTDADGTAVLDPIEADAVTEAVEQPGAPAGEPMTDSPDATHPHGAGGGTTAKRPPRPRTPKPRSTDGPGMGGGLFTKVG